MACPISDTLPTIATNLAAGGPLWGKAAFIAVFVLLLIWLLVLPAKLIGTDRGSVAWWRNARIWAVAVVIGQIVIYCFWG